MIDVGVEQIFIMRVITAQAGQIVHGGGGYQQTLLRIERAVACIVVDDRTQTRQMALELCAGNFSIGKKGRVPANAAGQRKIFEARTDE